MDDRCAPWLMELPNEILMTVMSHLDLRSLANATLVSRRFDDLAEPFLYQSLQILRGKNACSLTESIRRKHQRAIWINSLLVSTKHGNDHGLSLLPPYIRRMQNLRSLVLETPDCNALLPEKRLSWIDLQNRFERIFEAASILAPNKDRPLPYLQDCTLHFVDARSELYSLTKYPSIFLHPTLRNLTISCMSTDYPEKLPIDLQENPHLLQSTGLEYLHLEECDILPETLAVLLSLPRALKSLKISEGVRYDDMYRNGSSRMHGNVQPRRFMQALTQTCAETLESLSLSLGYRRRSGQEIHQIGQHLDMTSMTKLTYLAVDKKTLDLLLPAQKCDHNTVQRFPPYLETLKIFSISLGPRLPFEPRRKALVPIPACIIREKSKHGLCSLKNLVYSYDYHEDEDEDDDDTFPHVFNNTTMTTNLPLAHDHVVDPQGVTYNLAAHLPDATGHLQAADGTEPWRPVIATTNPQNIANDVGPQNIVDPTPYLNLLYATGSSQEFTRIERCKIALLNVLNGEVLANLKQTDTHLQVDLVTLPHGFIPPYLYPEEKPKTVENWWCSDNARETEEYKTCMRLAHSEKEYERPVSPTTQRERRSLRHRLGHIGLAALDWQIRRTPGA